MLNCCGFRHHPIKIYRDGKLGRCLRENGALLKYATFKKFLFMPTNQFLISNAYVSTGVHFTERPLHSFNAKFLDVVGSFVSFLFFISGFKHSTGMLLNPKEIRRRVF